MLGIKYSMKRLHVHKVNCHVMQDTRAYVTLTVRHWTISSQNCLMSDHLACWSDNMSLHVDRIKGRLASVYRLGSPIVAVAGLLSVGLTPT